MTKYTFYMHRICINFSSCIRCIFIHPFFSSCIHLYENIFTINPQSPVFVFLSQSQKLFHLPYFPIYASCKAPEIGGLPFCYSAILSFCHSILLCCSVILFFLAFLSAVHYNRIGCLYSAASPRMADLIFSQIRNGLLSCYN